MNTAWNGWSEPVDVEVGLEGVDLATEGVAAHGEVDHAEGPLVGPTVEHVGGQQDHPGAGAEGRHPVGQALRQRLAQPAAVQQQGDRGGLATGQDQAVDAVQIGPGLDA